MPSRRRSQPRLAAALRCAAALLVLSPLPAAAGPPPGPRDLGALQRSVAEIESLVAGAWFRKAIAAADATREWADDIPRSPEAKEARARLEVLASTAQIALGDEAAALRSMERAIYVWPLLHLDETTTSPRVVRLFHKLRGGSSRAAR